VTRPLHPIAAVLAVVFAVACSRAPAPPVQLSGEPAAPFLHSQPSGTVLLFVRTDCPISNRGAPELRRLAASFGSRFQFWLVYPDADAQAEAVRQHVSEYQLPGQPLLDSGHALVRLAQATVTPEAAVFNAQRQLVYHGRIDDRFIELGQARPEPTVRDLEQALAAVAAGRLPPVASTRAIGCAISPLP